MMNAHIENFSLVTTPGRVWSRNVQNMSTALADLTLDKTGSEIALEVAPPTDDTCLDDNVDTGVQVKQI